jgi:glycerophosphoryl diester phosphodiesterase
MNHAPRSALAFCATALLLLLPSVADAKAPTVHAHRGGSYAGGVPTFPENTMPAFLNSAKKGYVIELDVKLTKDGVPVVIHDDTFDRTTNCTGPIKSKTLAQVRKCRADVLGSPGNPGGLKTKKVAKPTVGISTLAEVLAMVKKQKATVNLEIKNLPGDNDFDAAQQTYPNKVMDTVIASKVPKSKLIIQSFLPGNLLVAKQRMPGVALSMLTTKGNEQAGLEIAKTNGFKWVSPSWPLTAAFVSSAHDAGKLVVPYTLDKASEVKAASAAGVDALITDDPVMARKALGLK